MVGKFSIADKLIRRVAKFQENRCRDGRKRMFVVLHRGRPIMSKSYMDIASEEALIRYRDKLLGLWMLFS